LTQRISRIDREKNIASFFIWFFLCASVLSLSALDVRIAAIVVQDEEGYSGPAARPSADLAERFGTIALGDELTFALADPSLSAPRSFLEAMAICESRAYSYLIYGFVKRTDTSLYAELKLVDAESGKLAANFFSMDGADDYGRLIDDEANKIVGYFRNVVGVAKTAPKAEPRRNVLLVRPGIGYWSPVSGQWDRAIAGLVSAGSGIRLVPEYPSFAWQSKECYWSAGLDVEYALGMNEPDYEESFLHVVKARLPIELTIELSTRHSLMAGIAGLFEMDILSQSRRYADTVLEMTAAPGLSAMIGYRYAVSKGFSVSLDVVLDAAFYDVSLWSISPRVCAIFPLGKPLSGESND